MNREIKFRAWNKKTNEFVENSSLKRCFDEKIDCVQFEADESVVIPIQYTGLKDKNGVEIYEGDIVIATDTNCEPYFTHSQVIVEWSDEICGFKLRHVSNTMSMYYEYEVVGNIYENTEILLVKQAIT